MVKSEGKNSRPVGNHNADISNSNTGTKGTNITYDQSQGNRGKQMNPNQGGSKKES